MLVSYSSIVTVTEWKEFKFDIHVVIEITIIAVKSGNVEKFGLSIISVEFLMYDPGCISQSFY